MKRIDQLTFTRFIAIIVVLFFHGGGGVYLQALNTFLPSALLVSSTTSVTYLYVLSGFVMSLVYYRPQEKFTHREILDFANSAPLSALPDFIFAGLLLLH